MRDILKLLAQEQGRALDHIAVAHEKEEAFLPLLAEVEPIHAVVEVAKANYGKIPMAVASGGCGKNHRHGVGSIGYSFAV